MTDSVPWYNPKTRVAMAIRSAPIAHRSGVVAVDKCAAITISAADQAGVVGVMANAVHRVAVAPRNAYGSVGASAIVTVTPTLNKTVDITIPQCVGATAYDVFFSTDAAPLWVGSVTEAQRAAGCAITAVGTVGAGGSAGKVNVRLVGTGLASSNAIFTANNAYTPDTVALAATAVPCNGYPRAYIDVNLTLTDLRSAPALSIVPFLKTDGVWYQAEAKALTLLSTVGHSLRQQYYLDVCGADAVEVLVGAIAGQGASAAFTVAPGV